MATVNKRVIKDISDGTKNLKAEFGIYIAPEENDFYKIHFVIPGPEETPYENGLYHGMIRLNNNHPINPPNIFMITPNGRFQVDSYPIPSGNRGICTTATAFHPETWTPMNNIETVLKGFLSLMCDTYDGGSVGGMLSTPEQTKRLAVQSIDHLKKDPIIKTLFPELYTELITGTHKKTNLGELCKTINMEKIPTKAVEGSTISDDENIITKRTPSKKLLVESDPEEEMPPIKISRKKKAPTTSKKVVKKVVEDDSPSDLSDEDDEDVDEDVESDSEDEIIAKSSKKLSRKVVESDEEEKPKKKSSSKKSKGTEDSVPEEKPKKKSSGKKSTKIISNEEEEEEEEEEEKPKKKSSGKKSTKVREESSEEEEQEEKPKKKSSGKKSSKTAIKH